MSVIFAAQAVLAGIDAGSDEGAGRVVDLALAVVMTVGTAIFVFAAVMLFREGRKPDPR